MNNRISLETALHEAIRDYTPGNFRAIEPIISSIQASSKASLDSVDDEGRSFLLYAMEVGAREVAEYLLELQINNKKIIFGKDINHKNILWHAASHGYINICKILLSLNPSEMIALLQASKCGNTPFHRAARIGNHAIIELLLMKTDEEYRAKKINQTNHDGNTALHEAFYLKSLNCIKALIQAGADLHIHNKLNLSPCMLLCDLPDNDRLAIYEQLDDYHKNVLFKSYRELLLLNPDLPEESINRVKEIYYECAGRRSLQELIIARFEFGSMAPSLEIQKKKLGENELYVVEGENEDLSIDDLLKRMPLYAARVLPGDEAIPLIRSLEHNGARELNYLYYQSLKKDIINLDRYIHEYLDPYIDEIGKYLRSLEHRRTHIPCKSIPIWPFILVFGWLGYLGIEPWFIFQIYANHEYKHLTNATECANELNNHTASAMREFEKHGCNIQKGPYMWVSIFFGVFAPIIVLGIAAIFSLNDVELKGIKVNIEATNEWIFLLNKLNNILRSLSELEQREKNDPSSKYLPTSMQNVQSLKKIRSVLEQKKMPVVELQSTLNELSSAIENMKMDMEYMKMERERTALQNIREGTEVDTKRLVSFFQSRKTQEKTPGKFANQNDVQKAITKPFEMFANKEIDVVSGGVVIEMQEQQPPTPGRENKKQ